MSHDPRAATVCSIVGARPQFVKAAPTSQAIRERHEEVLVHTGQHYDDLLSDVFFRELSVPEPDYNLDVGSAPHAVQTARMLAGIDEVFDEVDPDAVLVYGDTNSTLAGAIAAAKRDPPLIHVEAGLRSHDPSMPEEVNRRLTDHCADLLCAPCQRAVDTLASEGITDGVVDTGDVMYDALLSARDRAFSESTILADFDLVEGEYVLATVHRASNTEDPDRLASIVDGLSGIDDRVVLPAHPRTVEALDRHGLENRAADGIDFVDPVGYLDFLRLVAGARRVATDSGGVQKEAFYLATPCVTLRDRTEWTETVDCGWNVLVGADDEAIRTELSRPVDPPTRPTPYGDGDAATAIAEALDDVLE